MIDKEVINADEFDFVIKPIPAGGYGLFIENKHNHLLVVRHTVGECKDFLFSHFIGEKGTHFNIEVLE